MKFPTREQGHAAHTRGQADAMAGLPPETNPHDFDSVDSVEACLARAYSRGWHYGQQVNLQREYGDPPTD